MPKKSKKVFFFPIMIAAMAIMVGYFFFSSRKNTEALAQATPAKKPAVPVTSFLAHRGKVDFYLEAVGSTVACKSATVKVRIDGELKEIAFKEGQPVKKGELLAKIDDRSYVAALMAVKAQLQKDQATLDNAYKDLQRYEDLLEQKFINAQTLDTQKALVQQLEAQIATDKAQVYSAEVALSYTKIIAPFDGVTGMRLVDAGNLVHAADQTGLVVINQLNPICATFPLSNESVKPLLDLLKGSTASKAKVELSNVSTGQAWVVGHMILLNNSFDRASGSLEAKAEFTNPNNRLLPGEYANFRIFVNPVDDAFLLPNEAVLRGQKGQYVYRIKSDNKVELVPVEVVATQGPNSIVKGALNDSDLVVRLGQFRLTEGTLVKELAASPTDSTKG